MANQNKTDTDNGSGRAGETLEGARERTASAYETARERTSSAYETARDRASSATQRASEQVSTYPVGAVIGGFAVGALVAAVLPRTQREKELFGEYGHKLTDAAREAARNAADAGRDQMDEIAENAVNKVGSAVVSAVTSKD